MQPTVRVCLPLTTVPAFLPAQEATQGAQVEAVARYLPKGTGWGGGGGGV